MKTTNAINIFILSIKASTPFSYNQQIGRCSKHLLFIDLYSKHECDLNLIYQSILISLSYYNIGTVCGNSIPDSDFLLSISTIFLVLYKNLWTENGATECSLWNANIDTISDIGTQVVVIGKKISELSSLSCDAAIRWISITFFFQYSHDLCPI